MGEDEIWGWKFWTDLGLAGIGLEFGLDGRWGVWAALGFLFLRYFVGLWMGYINTCGVLLLLLLLLLLGQLIVS